MHRRRTIRFDAKYEAARLAREPPIECPVIQTLKCKGKKDDNDTDRSLCGDRQHLDI